MEFPGKKSSRPERPAADKEAGFLTKAKEQHTALFADYIARAEEYEFEEFMAALQTDTWCLTEALAKASWKNGIARGQARAGRAPK